MPKSASKLISPRRKRRIALSLILTDRDHKIMVLLWRFGTLLRDQVQALAFGGCALRRCNRRLKLLADAGFVEPFCLPLGTPPGTCTALRFTPNQWAYRAGKAAIPIITAQTGLDAAVVERRVVQGSPTYIAHALAVAQTAVAFHTGLTEATTDTDGHVSLILWRGEPELRHAYQYRAGGQEHWTTDVIKPDSLLTLRSEGREFLLFLEVDMGQMSPAAWKVKASLYARYSSIGAYRSRYRVSEADSFFGVLTVTTTPERRDRLLAFAREAGAGNLFRFGTTFSDLLTAGPAAPIWQGAGETPVPLSGMLSGNRTDAVEEKSC